ncbi:MAG: anti-sigma factor family protein [Planctomycetota bacterium]|jgi:hypothetical protein
MNEKHKHEVEELLSLYIDDQASQRQRTELKRLIRHDKAIAKRLESMKRQRQLLSALPVESAPASMVDDVRAALERKLILDDFSSGGETASGTSHLFARRMLTNAAMILIPMGLLGIVVYQIIKPPMKQPVQYVKTDEVLSNQQNDVGTTTVNPPVLVKADMPFKGTLIFTTDQQMTVSNFVKKMIFDAGLIDQTLPTHTRDVASYSIAASPQQITGLLNTLEVVWPRCDQVVLGVQNEDVTIQIADARLEQIKTLAAEDNDQMLARLATRYAAANLKKDIMVAKSDPADREFPPLSPPILTGVNVPPSVTADDNNAEIELKIYIKRSMD